MFLAQRRRSCGTFSINARNAAKVRFTDFCADDQLNWVQLPVLQVFSGAETQKEPVFEALTTLGATVCSGSCPAQNGSPAKSCETRSHFEAVFIFSVRFHSLFGRIVCATSLMIPSSANAHIACATSAALASSSNQTLVMLFLGGLSDGNGVSEKVTADGHLVKPIHCHLRQRREILGVDPRAIPPYSNS